MSIGMEGCGPNPRVYSKKEYDAVRAERDAALAELAALKGGQEPLAYYLAGDVGGMFESFCVSKLKDPYFTEPLWPAPPAQASALAPEGWRLVPVEPTGAMMLNESGCQHHAWDDNGCAARRVRFGVWAKMLAAAPTPGGEK